MSKRSGQSIVEYAILLGVVIAALLIMQMFIKRSYQGNLKDSADKMGDQFSASGTTTSQERKMTAGDDQEIVEGVATSPLINKVLPTGLDDAKDAVKDNVYSYSQRTGGESTSTVQSATDSSAAEITRAKEFQDEFANSTVSNFKSPIVAEDK